MKYALIGYVALMTLALALKPATVKQGPECGPGVLCIRTQKEVRAALQQGQRPLAKPLR